MRLLEINLSSLEFEFLAEEISDLEAHGLVPDSLQCDQDRDIVRFEHRDKKAVLNLYKHEIIAEKLYIAIFPDIDPYTLLANPSDSSVLHLRFHLPADNTPDRAQRILDTYPWELLGSSKLKTHFKMPVAVSRYVQQVQRPRKLPTIDRLNILFVRARPSGFEEDISNDSGKIIEAIEDNSAIRAHVLKKGTLQALNEYLDDSKNPKPQILHFDGHGIFGRYCTRCEEPFQVKTDQCPNCGRDLETGEGFLAFEQLSKKVHWVKASEFETIVCNHGIQLIFLNACRSARDIPTAFTGVAQQLVRTVPAVIATPFHLEALIASEFAQGFYRKLMQTGSLIESMESARKRLISSSDWKHGWYRFVLYLRYSADDDNCGRLFNADSKTYSPSDDIEIEVKRYKIRLISKIEDDAAHLKDVLCIEDYIHNYIELEAAPVLYPTLREKGNRQRLFDLLYSYKQYRVLLLGEPGAGKTTSLKRYAWELAQNYLDATPIVVSLQCCATRSLANVVLAELNRGGLLPRLSDEQELKSFLQSRSDIFLLLDGLNEIPSDATEAWTDINTFLNSISACSVVITCRTQNRDLEARLENHIERYLELQPLDKRQIDHYFPRLDDQEFLNPARVRGLARNPFLLTLLRNVQETHGVQFRKQHEVFARFISITLTNDRQSRIGHEVKDEIKLNALTYLAFYLNQKHRVSIDHNDCIEILSQDLNVKKESSIAIIESAIAHGFILKEQTASGKSSLSFAPNLMMQEYFAAWKLLEIVSKEFERPVTVKEIFAQLLARDRDIDVFTLAMDYLNPNPGLLKQLTRDPWWSETLVLLAGLLEDLDRDQSGGRLVDWFIGRLAIAWNARWLTKWLLAQGSQVKDDRILRTVEKWNYGLDNPDHNKRYEAVKGLLELTPRESPFPLPRTIPLLIKAAGDADYRVARAAYQGLASFREYETDLETITREMVQYHPTGARRVLLAVKNEIDLDFPLKMIPVNFMQISQSGYWISQRPVTNIEYKKFVTESGYPIYPENWEEGEFPGSENDHAVTFVSWDDACAYCAWLSHITGYYVRLPIEDEWGKIVLDENANSHSSVDIRTVINSDGSNPDNSTPIEVFQLGSKSDSCQNLAREVCEWCLPKKKLGASLHDKLMPLQRSVNTDTSGRILHAYEFERIDRRFRDGRTGFRIVLSKIALVKYSTSSDNIVTVQWC